MIARQKILVLLILFGCCTSIVLLAVAAGTEYWFTSVISSPLFVNKTDKLHYGLFKGVKEKYSGLMPTSYYIKLTCLSSEDVCMFSCGKTAALRQGDMEDLYFGNGTQISDTTICEPVLATRANFGAADGAGLDGTDARDTSKPAATADESIRMLLVTASLYPQTRNSSEDTSSEPALFMMHSLWLATLVFLGGGMLFALIGAVFAAVNITTNPIEAVTGVFGLYIWNGTAAVLDVLCMTVWAVQLHSRLLHNSMVRETLSGQYSTDTAALGFSFWLLFVAVAGHVINMALVFLASRVPDETPVAVDFDLDKTGGSIMMY